MWIFTYLQFFNWKYSKLVNTTEHQRLALFKKIAVWYDVATLTEKLDCDDIYFSQKQRHIDFKFIKLQIPFRFQMFLWAFYNSLRTSAKQNTSIFRIFWQIIFRETDWHRDLVIIHLVRLQNFLKN